MTSPFRSPLCVRLFLVWFSGHRSVCFAPLRGTLGCSAGGLAASLLCQFSCPLLPAQARVFHCHSVHTDCGSDNPLRFYCPTVDGRRDRPPRRRRRRRGGDAPLPGAPSAPFDTQPTPLSLSQLTAPQPASPLPNRQTSKSQLPASRRRLPQPRKSSSTSTASAWLISGKRPPRCSRWAGSTRAR